MPPRLAPDVVVVHRLRQRDVGVRVEAGRELLAVVLEVRLDRVATTVERLLVALAAATEAFVELELGPVRDLADPACERHPAPRTLARAPRRSSRRRGSSDRHGWRGSAASTSAISSAVARAPHAITTACGTRSGNATAHSSARWPPIDPPTTAAHRAMPSRSASAASTHHLVADRHDREARAVRRARGRIDRRRSGGALAAAEHVGAHHEEPVGVDRPARADDRVPPTLRARDRVRPVRPRGCRR